MNILLIYPKFPDTFWSFTYALSFFGKKAAFPPGQLFYPPMASPKEPRTHVTYLSLDLPNESINIASAGFGDSFGLVRWTGWGGMVSRRRPGTQAGVTRVADERI